MPAHDHKYLVVGAGFSGAVLARELATNLDCAVTVIDARPHLSGNCHTERDSLTGVMIHKYGPHIFNTNNQGVWNYVNRFGILRPYINRVKVSNSRGIFSFPINLHTINQFFGKRLDPASARNFLASLGDKSIGEPRNFEEQALKFVGRELYEAFFYGYTKKQWGCDPSELPASILKRLPIRFNYDDNYYNKNLQGIPENGYTEIIEKILDHPQIKVELSSPFEHPMQRHFTHTFYTGPLDAYFGFSEGRLGYRTVTFERIDEKEDYQGNAVINFTGIDEPFTRIHEHKHFTPWENHALTVAFKEFSKETQPEDLPYYPKRLSEDMEKLRRYRQLAASTSNISFLGRLGTYRYLDMDAVINESLNFSATFLTSVKGGIRPPIFSNTDEAG